MPETSGNAFAAMAMRSRRFNANAKQPSGESRHSRNSHHGERTPEQPGLRNYKAVQEASAVDPGIRHRAFLLLQARKQRTVFHPVLTESPPRSQLAGRGAPTFSRIRDA